MFDIPRSSTSKPIVVNLQVPVVTIVQLIASPMPFNSARSISIVATATNGSVPITQVEYWIRASNGVATKLAISTAALYRHVLN